MTTQNKALRLADELESAAGNYFEFDKHLGYDSAAELRRLQAENERLKTVADTDKASADHWRQQAERQRKLLERTAWHVPPLTKLSKDITEHLKGTP